MNTLSEILKIHAARYPKMQPTDAVKLIYQNEFGGGHLIKDEQACLAYLQKEYEATEKDASIPSWEDIGNGIVRVHLAPLPERDLAGLGQAFIRSAQKHRGSLPGFLKKLDILRELTKAGVFSFNSEQLNAYLAEYEAMGYPAVSHSDPYREAYHPAYRIVCKAELSVI